METSLERPRVNGQPPTPSKYSCSKEDLVSSVMLLCSAKRTVEFTPAQLITWHAFLGGFQARTITQAAIEIAATNERFPDLSDLLAACRRIERPPEHDQVSRGDPKPIYRREIVEIAARLGLEV
jgi:hypothetical protein